MVPLAAQAEFNEKYLYQGMDPIDRSQLGAQVENAALARIGDIYYNFIQNELQNPNMAAKMSERAIQQTRGLVTGTLTPRQRALQLLAWVNDDATPYESVVGAGPISAKLAFSPSHNVIRLSWSNVSLREVLC